jgi:hypothetical protein
VAIELTIADCRFDGLLIAVLAIAVIVDCLIVDCLVVDAFFDWQLPEANLSLRNASSHPEPNQSAIGNRQSPIGTRQSGNRQSALGNASIDNRQSSIQSPLNNRQSTITCLA